jgi:hypothetical protein
MLVAVSITETVLLIELFTYTVDPVGCTVMPTGFAPTGIVVVTVFVAVSITDTWSITPCVA